MNPITRQPASIKDADIIIKTSRQILSQSPILDETIIARLLDDVSIRNEVDVTSGVVVAKTIRFKSVTLQNEIENKYPIFAAESELTLNFESTNEASSSRKAEFILTGALKPENCRAGYCELKIPFKDIFVEDVRDNEMSIGQLNVALKNINVASGWPQKWVLGSIKYSKKGSERDPSSMATISSPYTFQFQTNRIRGVQPIIIER